MIEENNDLQTDPILEDEQEARENIEPTGPGISPDDPIHPKYKYPKVDDTENVPEATTQDAPESDDQDKPDLETPDNTEEPVEITEEPPTFRFSDALIAMEIEGKHVTRTSWPKGKEMFFDEGRFYSKCDKFDRKELNYFDYDLVRATDFKIL